LGYHRTNYLNIIRYAEKLLRLPLKDRTATAALKEALEQEEVLTEKAFFLGLINGR
jgi:hypothetical protein